MTRQDGVEIGAVGGQRKSLSSRVKDMLDSAFDQHLFQAVVTDVRRLETDTGVTVRIQRAGSLDNDPVYYPCLNSYAPHCDDEAICLQRGASIVVLGSILPQHTGTDAHQVLIDSTWSQDNSGSGGTTRKIRHIRAFSGTTPFSRGKVRLDEPTIGWQRGEDGKIFNWNRPFRIEFDFALDIKTPNGESWITFGKNNSDHGAPVNKAIGIRVDGDLSVHAVAHDGTTLHVSDPQFIATEDIIHGVWMEHRGDEIKFCVDAGTGWALGGGGPLLVPISGDGDWWDTNIQVESFNNDDAADQSITLYEFKFWR